MVNISSTDLRRIMAKREGVPVKRRAPSLRIVDPGWLERMKQGPGIFLPLRTQTPGNQRRHWRKDADEAEHQREHVTMALMAHRLALPPFPVKVLFVRYGPGKLPDKHNLPGMLKHVIDALAKFYGVDDGDDRWDFDFSREKSESWGVRMIITPITA